MDRNLLVSVHLLLLAESPSSRRAWIEITTWEVATKAFVVALLTEGVDRNQLAPALATIDKVALLTEGVDRNLEMLFSKLANGESPSSRRAWIEILSRSVRRSIALGRPPRGGRG